MKSRLVLVLAALIAASACYIFGFLHQTPERSYTGIRSLNASDYNTNLSWLDQSKDGHFLMKNKFTSLPQAGAFVRPLYFFLSQPFRLTNLSTTAGLHILRVICGFVLLWLLFPLLHRFTPDPPIVRRAFLLLAFSSGVGILTHRWISSVDMGLPEGFLFLTLGENPHFIYSQLFLWAGLASIYSGNPSLYFGCLLILWWEHPFEAVILIIVATANLWILRDRKKQVLTLFVTAGVSLPAFLYYQRLKSIPAFSGWGSVQNQMTSPDVLSMLSGFLPLILLAVAGSLIVRRETSRQTMLRFLLIWIVVQFVFVYLPFPFQRRLIAGIQFPLALLGAFAIRNVHKIALALLILVLGSTNIWNLVQWIREMHPRQMPYYMSASYQDAMRWLSREPDKDAVVVSGFVTGNFIPGVSGLTAYMGHSSLTPNVAQCRADALKFYQNPDMQFLLRNRIQYIFWGSEERHMTNVSLENLFEVAYKNEEVMILLPRPKEEIPTIARERDSHSSKVDAL